MSIVNFVFGEEASVEWRFVVVVLHRGGSVIVDNIVLLRFPMFSRNVHSRKRENIGKNPTDLGGPSINRTGP